MVKKSKISDSESDLFRQAMRKVRPLKQPDKVNITPEKPSSKPKKSSSQTAITAKQAPLSDYQTEIISNEDQLFYAKAGIRAKTLKQLRRGEFFMQATLDLHGKTVEQARGALLQFITNCQQRGLRYVLVIHGKGYEKAPILKNKVNTWLKQLEQVLAFSSAQPRHGGSGALYVLLAR